MAGAKGFEPSTSWSRTRDKNHLSRCPGVSYSFSGRSLLDKFWTSSVAQRPLFLAARSSRTTAGGPDAAESLLFDHFRVALSRESARRMPFPFQETPIAYEAARRRQARGYGIAVCHGFLI